jgi:hypothetical protein
MALAAERSEHSVVRDTRTIAALVSCPLLVVLPSETGQVTSAPACYTSICRRFVPRVAFAEQPGIGTEFFASSKI